MLLLHGEADTTVGLFHSQRLAKGITEAGGKAHLKTYPEMNHTDPLVSIASPWRDRRDIVAQITQFVGQLDS